MATKGGLEALAEWFAPLSVPRKLLACLGLFLMIAGVIWFKATLNWADMGWSALAVMLGLGLVGLADRARAPTDS
ncbi:hypothetical protein [Inhella sp.]|uniref:hypothetical protein n=1 Tax=Inhella sp. TaxID=1921806 RepID=UPI0035B30526